MKKRVISILVCAVLLFSIMSAGAFAAQPRDTSFEEGLAVSLKTLGLFRGVSETNFDLGREPTRTEALVMLIRALGRESEALKSELTHPFDDVPAWADKYVAYAYENGLTNGVSATKFGGEAAAGSNMYLTFMLRALGYSDANDADFSWSSPYSLSRTTGILPSYADTENFLRADVVSISYASLSAYLKNSQQTLAGKLISMGVFTEEEFARVYDPSLVTAKPQTNASGGESSKRELSSEEIYAECSPAVFYIETYDASGSPLSGGSGFFIESDGTAVTNYHVIKGAKSAKITLSETGRTLDVEGVYASSESEDWAVLKISGTGFPTLPMNAETPAGGAVVYAIGSPLGLQNTISQGIVSNPSRLIEGHYFIQTSAAISNGSSGGALINKYGEVIGITYGSYVNGQLLNLAVPLSYVSGYSKASLTALSRTNAQSGTSGTANTAAPERQKEAYNALRAWLVRNGTRQTGEDGGRVYLFQTQSSDEYGGVTTYILGYYVSSGNIAITDSYMTDETAIMHLTTVLTEETEPYIFSYEYKPSVYSRPTLDAVGFYYAPAFDESSELAFYSTSGILSYDSEAVYTNQVLAKYLLLELLNFTDYIFESDIPAYGIADFGFAKFAR